MSPDWKSIGFRCFLKLWEAKLLKKHLFSLLFEAPGSKSIEKAVVFVAFWSSGKQKCGKSIGFHCFLKLWEATVLKKQWFSLLFEALGNQSIEKALVVAWVIQWIFRLKNNVYFRYLRLGTKESNKVSLLIYKFSHKTNV